MAGLKYGEIIIGIRPKGLRSLLKLGENKTYRDAVPHSDIVAQNSSLVSLKEFVFRRPTLAEYTTLMDRVATPNYPKDIPAIVGMLDVSQDSCVLEAGTGSGSLTLHLSRAVGATGHVYSFESIPRHMEAAKRNYSKWRANWAIGRESEWPDNVTFVQEDVKEAGVHITRPVDYVALDVADPGPLLSHLLPKLRPSTPISVYLTNLSQFMIMCETIRQEQVNVELERVVEVIHRDWEVKPAMSKGSRLHTAHFADKYICRPSYNQLLHSGFIGLLRSLNPAQFSPQYLVQPTTKTEDG